MMRSRKRWNMPLFFFLTAVLAFLLFCPAVLADTSYVYDNAGLLNVEEEKKLENACTQFEAHTGNHIVILTEHSSGTEKAQAIADDFYDKKFPSEKDENGVCFLIDMGQRQIVISTSGIMRYYLSDSEIEDILEEAKDSASEGDYEDAFEEMIEMTLECYDRGVSEGDYLVDENGKVIHYRTLSFWECLFAAAAAVVTGLLVYLGIRKSYQKKKSRGAESYAKLGENSMSNRKDILMDRSVITRRIPKNPPPGEGGSGGSTGGSSVHTSSSGRSHGGGSVGF